VTYVLEPQAMRAADTAACAAVGEDTLMQTAGERIAERLRGLARGQGKLVAFAGPGNNGGDAFAAFALLARQYECIVYSAPAPHPSPARAAAEARARSAGVAIHPLPLDDAGAGSALAGALVAIDALFGTGARLPIPDGYRAATRALDARVRCVLAVDIPSGVDAATGAVDAGAVRASETVTLGAVKPGLLLDPGREYCGALWLAEIGIADTILSQQPRRFTALDDREFLSLLPRRGVESDKRASGAPLVIAGSPQFPGAAVLCARAAARAGAGYVTVATPAGAANLLRAHLVEQVVVTIPDDVTAEAAIDDLIDISKHNASVAIGPGLGLDDRTGEIVRGFLSRNELPAVVDAGALFHLAKHLELLRGKHVVLTPHAGEFARLSGLGTVRDGERVSRLREFVERTGITTLLKGRATLIFDGTTMHVNVTGTSALATAGSGDVLTGMTSALLSQGLAPVDAAAAAAYWHGLAGQSAQRERRIGVVAGDVIAHLGPALPVPRTVGVLHRIC
jgi:ADP-dependent NAD(P)H-hydrate dehydratase / NAD(P)H-hydrate epimerase